MANQPTLTKAQAIAIGLFLAVLLAGTITMTAISDTDKNSDQVLGVQVTRPTSEETTTTTETTVATVSSEPAVAETTVVPSPRAATAPAKTPPVTPTTLPSRAVGATHEASDNTGFVVVSSGAVDSEGSSTRLAPGAPDELTSSVSLRLETGPTGKELVYRVDYRNNMANTVRFDNGTQFVIFRNGVNLNVPTMRSPSITHLPGGASGFLEGRTPLPGDGHYDYSASADVIWE